MSQPALQVSRLSKRYRLGEYSADTQLRDAIMRTIGKLIRRERKPEQVVWALNDVSFDVRPGEVLGVIGRNGAGKSTLLKLLSRITYPTSGTVRVRGRVASLLEVGTGFHEELTGRENIYLNGSILGMKKQEIDARLEEIVDFSGVSQFIDTPIKRYSSGMRLRLGFAVAAHLSPDILLVDEVLAVGDADFQKKCLNAMDDLRSSGRTVLFVSHNMAAVESLCSRCIWIEAGQLRADGEARSIVSDYMRTFAQASAGTVTLEDIESRSGNGEGRFTHIEFMNEVGKTTNYIRSGDRLTFRLHYRANKVLRDLVVGITFHNEYGTLIAASNNWATGDDIPVVNPGAGFADFEIDCLYLLPGRYYLSLWLGKWSNQHDVLKNCISFDVEPSDYYGSGRGIDSSFGLMFFPSRWKLCPPQERGLRTGT
ncbi:MAG: ABC transporter ATP-binding protein [Gammaproteobacteria bacterium]